MVSASRDADRVGPVSIQEDWPSAEDSIAEVENTVKGILGPDGIHEGKRARNPRLALLLGPDITHDGRKRSRNRNVARFRPLSVLLRPDITHDGRRKRFSSMHKKSLQTSTMRPGGAYDPYLIALLRPDIIHDGKRSAETDVDFDAPLPSLDWPSPLPDGKSSNSDKKKRLLDSLAMARPIHSGRKRFLETLARVRPIHQGRRKRLLDSLVRARPIYNGRR